MDLEDITPTEISQTEKYEYCMVSLVGYRKIKKNKPSNKVNEQTKLNENKYLDTEFTREEEGEEDERGKGEG